ncbi:MAG: hypothetical protein IJN71_03355 [Oscillospiraceae bacterium]|nr:hypothetical protein [Oscillospiraceae bacterium]
MKKFFGSIVCLLICVSMVFALCGCESAEQREAAVREVTDGYLSAVCELDFIGAAGFTVEGESVLEGSTVKNIDDLREQFSQIVVDSAGEEFLKYKEKFAPISDVVIDAMKNSLSYEIASVEEEGKKYAVSAKITYMDENADFVSLLGLNEAAATELATNILKSLVESGKFTEKTTEQELMDLMIDPLVAEITKRIEAGIKNVGTTDEEIRLIVEKKDGAWKINDSESDTALSELAELQ